MPVLMCQWLMECLTTSMTVFHLPPLCSPQGVNATISDDFGMTAIHHAGEAQQQQ